MKIDPKVTEWIQDGCDLDGMCLHVPGYLFGNIMRNSRGWDAMVAFLISDLIRQIKNTEATVDEVHAVCEAMMPPSTKVLNLPARKK